MSFTSFFLVSLGLPGDDALNSYLPFILQLAPVAASASNLVL